MYTPFISVSIDVKGLANRGKQCSTQLEANNNKQRMSCPVNIQKTVK